MLLLFSLRFLFHLYNFLMGSLSNLHNVEISSRRKNFPFRRLFAWSVKGADGDSSAGSFLYAWERCDMVSWEGVDVVIAWKGKNVCILRKLMGNGTMIVLYPFNFHVLFSCRVFIVERWVYIIGLIDLISVSAFKLVWELCLWQFWGHATRTLLCNVLATIVTKFFLTK